LRPAQAKVRCYLKNELKQKGLEVWFMRQNACLASTNPELSLWYCQKKKKKKNPRNIKQFFVFIMRPRSHLPNPQHKLESQLCSKALKGQILISNTE
jgi:hypothetical protein